MSGKKGENPKEAVGKLKVSQSCVSRAVLAEVAVGMMEGARKYGRHNYRDTVVTASVYMDAACRHLDAWWEGEDIDPDSGVHHISKLIANLTVLRDAMIQNKLHDDRPPPTPLSHNKYVQSLVGAILHKYPECKEPITHHCLTERVKIDLGKNNMYSAGFSTRLVPLTPAGEAARQAEVAAIEQRIDQRVEQLVADGVLKRPELDGRK